MQPNSMPQQADPTNIVLQNRDSAIFPDPSKPNQVIKLFNTNSPEAYREVVMHKIASELTIGVVGYVDVYFDEGRLGIVMEECQWESVGRMRMTLEQEKLRRWAERDLLCIAMDMMKVVSALHSVCIAHQNLGLDNWLLSGNNCLRLSDFGSAQHVRMPFSEENSPFRGDIFQLGANLYELAFQRPCRVAASCAVDILRVQLHSKATIFQYSSDLVDLIVKLMTTQEALQGCIRWTEGKIGGH